MPPRLRSLMCGVVGTAAFGLAGMAGAQGAPIVVTRDDTTRVVVDPDAPLGASRPRIGTSTWDALHIPSEGTPLFCERQPPKPTDVPEVRRLLVYQVGIGAPDMDILELDDPMPLTRRTVVVGFDSTGAPRGLTAVRMHEHWGVLTVVFRFPVGGQDEGHVAEVTVDSAAAAAALASGDPARRSALARSAEVTQREARPEEARRARALAEWLWPRRCTNVAAPRP